MCSDMCTNSPVFGMCLSLLFACTLCLPVSYHQGYRMIQGRHMPHNLLQNIASVLSVNHRNPRIVESCSQEANFDLASDEDYSSKTQSLLQVLEILQRSGAISIGTDYAYTFLLRTLKLFRFTHMAACFLFCFLGEIDSPSTDALV